MDTQQINDLKQFIFTSLRQVVGEEVHKAVDKAVETAVDRVVGKAVKKATAHLTTKTELKLATAHLASKDDLKNTERRLNRRLDTMQSAIIETITNVNDAHDEHFNEHEARLIQLERFAGIGV